MSLTDDLRALVAAGTAEYTAGTVTFWTDAQLQGALDHNRTLIDYQPITWHPRVYGGGSAEYKRGSINTSQYVEAGTAGGTVQDYDGGTITGWTLSRDGWIDFAADTAGSALYFSAWSYDLNAAAAEVCTSWASALKGLVDVATDDQSLKLSQKRMGLIEMAQEFRKKAPVKEGRLTRGDAQ